MSKDDKGHIKLEYTHNGKQRIMLWETRDASTLETLFDADGSILMQKMANSDKDALARKIANVLKEANVSGTKETAYSDVRFNRPCPKCGERKLLRYVEAFSSKREVSIMPLYHCQNCSTKSYHLTDDYLGYLVDNNTEHFGESELLEMKKNREAFLAELKGYIIRIFASKKIMCIA